MLKSLLLATALVLPVAAHADTLHSCAAVVRQSTAQPGNVSLAREAVQCLEAHVQRVCRALEESGDDDTFPIWVESCQ
jgi:hypothetical protein